MFTFNDVIFNTNASKLRSIHSFTFFFHYFSLIFRSDAGEKFDVNRKSRTCSLSETGSARNSFSSRSNERSHSRLNLNKGFDLHINFTIREQYNFTAIFQIRRLEKKR